MLSRVKDPADCADMETLPGVPPVVARLNRITLDVVQADVVTVTDPGVPDIAAVTPTESLAAVDAWITSLLPAEPRTRLPLVAVIAPDVAVSVVVAVTDPGAVRALAKANVTVDPLPVVVIWLAVPARVMALPDGVADPEPALTVLIPEVPPPICSQLALPELTFVKQ